MSSVPPSPDAPTSRILTLVFTDLQDSTALKSARGDLLAGDVIARHRGHLSRLAGECSGRIVDYAGDGCFLTFETPTAAVRFALRLQEAHHAEGDLPGVRIGIHMGEVTEAPGPLGADGPPRVEGLAVDLAARVQGLARPGQVLLSSAVSSSARQRLEPESAEKPIRWRTYGPYRLKGVEEPVEIGEAGIEGVAPLAAPAAGEKGRPAIARAGRRALAAASVLVVAAAALWAWRALNPSNPSGAAAPIRSLAVLPLENLSGDPGQEYFADGMTEALIGDLAKIGSLRVISRTSVMPYKGARKPLREIAEQLGVDAIVEGTVLREGDQVRISAQLIDARSDDHVWAERYQRDLQDILALQSDVAREIARRIAAELTPQEAARLAATRAVDPRAHDAYLRGRHQWNTFTIDGVQRALEYFETAAAIDPTYARAHAGIAQSYYWLTAPLDAMPHREGSPKVRAAALRALELDEKLGEAHGALGWILFYYDWDWEGAERAFRRAIELSPSDPFARLGYAFMLLCLGRTEEGLAQGREAATLAPMDVLVQGAQAEQILYARRYEESLQASRRVVEMDPGYVRAYDNLRWLHERLRDEPAMLEASRELLLRRGDGDRVPALEKAYAEGGLEGYWRFWVEEERRLHERYGSNAGMVARAYAYAGDLDRAFEWLERAYALRDGDLAELKALPWTDELRGDPRYRELLRRVGLPEESGPP